MNQKQTLKRYEGGKPGAKYWKLSIWYELDKCGEIDDEISAAIGSPPDGAGTGFDQRDMDWDFADKASAHAAQSQVQRIIGPRHGFHTAIAACTDE